MQRLGILRAAAALAAVLLTLAPGPSRPAI
jgi:hypothetical protein